ncbi:MAG TPA: adenylosuccinate synthase [Anaerolineaceae bacterium]|nr:adenylosuccinate synthase [Anaerolineaceae bacterium]HPN50695.1 adenylosuccinate synthase [Anaerolineaceae bacterium]
MALDIIVGAQWGDEGKGRIVDLLSAQADVVARFNGGDNAGHTVNVAGQTFKLHLIPSGIIHPRPVGIMGNGMVINPLTLLKELDMLAENGVTLSPGRLQISYAAHLITPAHRALDQAQEKSRGQGQIGTTGRGIGPAYTDKASRRGLRMADMLDPKSFAEKMAAHINDTNLILQKLYGAEPLDANQVAEEYRVCAEKIAPYISDTAQFLAQALKQGRSILAEGAQGTLLDIDHGTYPYVTSSPTTAAGVLSGLGLGISPIGRVIGATKSFQTRVGSGPFPTEVFDEDAVRLRGTGANPWDEFGTTTGRPRRVGWLDTVLLRYAARVNGLTELVITKMDVLSGLPSVRICSAYRAGSETFHELPLGPADLSPYTPVYEDLPGWQADLTGLRSAAQLPAEARAYLRRIEELTGVPVSLVSVGPERSQVIQLN